MDKRQRFEQLAKDESLSVNRITEILREEYGSAYRKKEMLKQRADLLQREQKTDREKYTRKEKYISLRFETFLKDMSNDIESEFYDRLDEIKKKRLTKDQLINEINEIKKENIKQQKVEKGKRPKSYFIAKTLLTSTKKDVIKAAQLAENEQSVVLSLSFNDRNKKEFLEILHAGLDVGLFNPAQVDEFMLNISDMFNEKGFREVAEKIIRGR